MIHMKTLTFITITLAVFSTHSVNADCDCSCDPECSSRPDLPKELDGSELNCTSYENWSKDFCFENIWVFSPKTTKEVATLANWAYKKKYKLRAAGGRFSWSPMTIVNLSSSSSSPSSSLSCRVNKIQNVILVATQKYLKRITVLDNYSAIVEAGATLNDVSALIEKYGYGIPSLPAMGYVTMGGAVATGTHGSFVNEKHCKNTETNSIDSKLSGSISNSILALKAVVWNNTSGMYEIWSFDRSDPTIAPLLTCLGRCFITEVTLKLGKDEHLRCLSLTDIPIKTIFARPNGKPVENSFASLLHRCCRLDVLFYPFADTAWVRIWEIALEEPASSRFTDKPYNYKFEENFPDFLTSILGTLLEGNSPITVLSNRLLADFAKLALKLFFAEDLWGLSKNVLYFVKPSTLRVSVNSFAILTTYSTIQETVSLTFEIVNGLIFTYLKNGKYPLNGPIEFRVTSLDESDDGGSVAPSFSPCSPMPSRPDYNICLWMDITTLSKTNHVNEFMFDIQSRLYHVFDGKEGRPLVRPEWSKRWAFVKPQQESKSKSEMNDGADADSDSRFQFISHIINPKCREKQDLRGAWSNQSFFQNIPPLFADWSGAANKLKGLDPAGVFQSPLFESILP